MTKLDFVLKNNNRLINVKFNNGEIKRIKNSDAYKLVIDGKANYCSKTEYNNMFRKENPDAVEIKTEISDESKKVKKSDKKKEKGKYGKN